MIRWLVSIYTNSLSFVIVTVARLVTERELRTPFEHLSPLRSVAILIVFPSLAVIGVISAEMIRGISCATDKFVKSHDFVDMLKPAAWIKVSPAEKSPLESISLNNSILVMSI